MTMNQDPFFKPLDEMVAKLGRTSRPRNGDADANGAPGESREIPAKTSPRPESETPSAAKPKIARLSNPRWEAEAVGFNEETLIAVDLELPPAIAHKTKVTFELFAKTPKGPEKISQSESNAKDGKAVCAIPVYIPAYRDEEGNSLNKVEYHFNARHSEAEPLDGSKSGKWVEEMAALVLEAHILQNITFATGKSFIRASEAMDLKGLGQAVKDWKGKHAGGKLAVFGHADAEGEELPSKRLSERRAKAVHAYLAKDPKPWEDLYGEEKWGLATVQELLKHLGHDPGAIDGQDGPKTQAAVKEFQAKKGLSATGNVDAKTREALFLAYFESAGTPGNGEKDFDAIDGKAFTGCGEFNPIGNAKGANEANRRVAVLLLKVSKNFPIHYPCKQGDTFPCRKQAGLKGERRTPGFSCRFYDKLVEEKKGVARKPAGKLKWIGLKDDDEIKQYVNLKADQPGQGPERVFEAEIEGAADGTTVFWRVYADPKNSKRNHPKPGIKSEAIGKLTEFKDGLAELETETKGGKASVVLACGLAGGDRYQVEAGTERGKSDASVMVVNWRKLYYQLTYQKDLRPPSMATAVKKLKEVFIEWIAEPEYKHDFMKNGKVIVGNHNAEKFHSLLRSNKIGQCAHVIFCDFQYDGLSNGKNIELESDGLFKTASGLLEIGDAGSHLAVPNPPVQEKAKLVLLAYWKNTVTGKSGNLTEDPGALDANTGLITWMDENHWRVNLPANATPSEKGPVKVKIRCTGSSGPWGGDGGTAPHNLIVIYNEDTIHSMCVMHELGHIMNMVPQSGNYKAPPGLLLNHKFAYEGKGGSGSHCGFEIDKTASNSLVFIDGKCIMFHQLTLACELKYCPECAPFVKAQGLQKFQDLKG